MTNKTQQQREALRAAKALDDAHDLSAFTSRPTPIPAAPSKGIPSDKKRKSAKAQSLTNAQAPRAASSLFSKNIRLGMAELSLLMVESQRRRALNGGKVRGEQAEEQADVSALVREAIQKTFGRRRVE